MQKGEALILLVGQDAGRRAGLSGGGASRTKENGEPWGPRIGIKKALQSEQATAAVRLCAQRLVRQPALAWSLLSAPDRVHKQRSASRGPALQRDCACSALWRSLLGVGRRCGSRGEQKDGRERS